MYLWTTVHPRSVGDSRQTLYLILGRDADNQVMIEHRSRHGLSLPNHITESHSGKRMFDSECDNNYWLYVGRVLHALRFPCGDLGNEKTEFYRIAWAGITCCDIVQHRDRHRIAGAIVDEPADCWIMIDAIECDLMAVFGEDRLQ